MRPTTSTAPPAAEALLQGVPRPRKHSDPHTAAAAAAPQSKDDRGRDHSPPIMYFLAGEATVQAAAAAAAAAASASASMSSNGSSTFGVRSLEASVSDSELRGRERTPPTLRERASFTGEDQQQQQNKKKQQIVLAEAGRGNDNRDHHHHYHEDGEDEAPADGDGDADDADDADGDDDNDNDNDEDEDDDELDARSMASLSTATQDFMSGAPSPKTNLSQPLTPMLGPSIAPSPVVGSPVTPRSACEREGEEDSLVGAPQLIMPQIVIPSRRPFTDKGKRIGKLKMLIAGDSGIGKTSLIKSIVQVCEDIVHVDPVPTNTALGARHGTSSRRAGDAESTGKISEVYASTRPYPHWWSEIDESKVLRRRKSRGGMDEQVIERNLTFVDTPGYGSGTSFLECIEPVVRYVESQFERTLSILSSGEGELTSLLSGAGTPQVDIVLYVILHRLKPVDIEFIRRLSPFTNVLPVIAKSDTLTAQQLTSLKLSILNDLRSAGVRPFLFGKSSSDILRSTAFNGHLPTVTAPFAISSILSSDSENMDASVLMSPDYVPPLLDTELKLLVDQIFEPDNIAWLKHATAKKFMDWRAHRASWIATNPPQPNSPGRPSTPLRNADSPPCNSLVHLHRPVSGAADSFALARVADHTQREERLAKVRLSRWANDLQRSLQAERDRYERLARGERAVWLTERLGECVADGQLVPISVASRGHHPNNNHHHHHHHPHRPLHGKADGHRVGGGSVVDTRDPFGILQLNESVGRRVLVMIKIAGLGGLVGVVGVWVYKQWGADGFHELIQEVRSR